MKNINKYFMTAIHVLEKIIVAIAVLLACRKFLFLDDDLKKVTNRKTDK